MSPSVSFETLEQKVCYGMLFLNIISKFLEKCINLSAIRTDKNRCGDVCYKMKTHQIPAAVLYHVSPKKRKKKPCFNWILSKEWLLSKAYEVCDAWKGFRYMEEKSYLRNVLISHGSHDVLVYVNSNWNGAEPRVRRVCNISLSIYSD